MQNETATTVGHWSWDPDLKRLRIDPDRSAALDDISGSWSLNALGVLLDGFSRSRLERALDPASGARRDIACAVGLSSGGAIRLVGRFDARGGASGDLVRDDTSLDGGIIPAPGPGLDAAFQPIVSLTTGRIAGFEALARWDGAPPSHQAGGQALSDDALAPNMLIRASEALASWQKAGHHGLFVNVNLTGRDLASEDLEKF